MRCAKCGCVYDEGMFCPECGTKYDAEAEQKYEAELKHQQEIEEQERQKRQEEEEKAKEIKRQEEKEKRELEIEKAKAEQERLAKERAEQEAEVLKLRKEEAKRKAAEEEKLSRTFNGVEYQTVDEAKAASVVFEEEQAATKAQKKVDAYAICSMIFGIAAWPLTMVMIGEFLTIPAVILGVKALRRKTTKKGFAIVGILSVVIYVAVIVIGLVLAFNE